MMVIVKGTGVRLARPPFQKLHALSFASCDNEMQSLDIFCDAVQEYLEDVKQT